MIELNVMTRKSEDSLNYLRSQEMVPGVCYSGDGENLLVSFNENEFRKVYRETGTSGVISFSGDLKEKQVLVQDIQVHVVSGQILHVDFKLVKAGETTEVRIPVVIEGGAPAVSKKLGVLNVVHDEITIEAVPSKIPSELIIDISGLNEVGDSITVADLNLPSGVVAVDEDSMTVVTISGLQEEKEDTGPSMEEVLAEPNTDSE